MARNLFEHIKGITKDKISWDSLGEEDKKSWSNFIISRWLSMDMELVEYINMMQQYSNGILTSKDYYKCLYHALPKSSFYLKYTKKKSKIEIDQKFIELFCNHFALGKSNIYEYISILKKTNPGELTTILKKYGSREEDIKLFEKQLKTIP
jgi:hypothetical protein